MLVTLGIQNVRRWLGRTVLIAWWNSDWTCQWDHAASHTRSNEELLFILTNGLGTVGSNPI